MNPPYAWNRFNCSAQELDMLAMAAPTKPLSSVGAQLHHHAQHNHSHHVQQQQILLQQNQAHYHQHLQQQHHQSVSDMCLQNSLGIPSSSSCDPTQPSSSEMSSSSCSPTTSDILRGIKAASMNDATAVRLLQQQVKTEPFDMDYTQAMMPLHLGFSSNGHCSGPVEVLLHSRSSTATPSVSRRRSAHDGMIKCLFCPKKAANQAALEAHIQECRVLRCHECAQCGKRFKARGGLQQHMRIHNNDKPYACNFCNKKFTQKSHVDQHERIHTGAKPFTCQYCGRAFRQRSQQLGHESTHGNQASGSGNNGSTNNNNNNNNGNENMQRNAENRVPHDPAPSSSDSSQQFSNLRSMQPQQQLEHCVSTQAVTNLLALSQQHQQLQDNSIHSGVNLNQNGMGLGPMTVTSTAATLHMNQMNMNPYMQHSSLLNHMI